MSNNLFGGQQLNSGLKPKFYMNSRYKDILLMYFYQHIMKPIHIILFLGKFAASISQVSCHYIFI